MIEQLFANWAASIVDNAPLVGVFAAIAWDFRRNFLQCIEDTRKLNQRLLDCVLPDDHES